MSVQRSRNRDYKIPFIFFGGKLGGCERHSLQQNLTRVTHFQVIDCYGAILLYCSEPGLPDDFPFSRETSENRVH